MDVGPLRQEVPEDRRATVTDDGAGTAGQDGGHFASSGALEGADLVHPSMDATEAPGSHVSVGVRPGLTSADGR